MCTCRSGSRRRSACNCSKVKVEGYVGIGEFAGERWAIGLGHRISY